MSSDTKELILMLVLLIGVFAAFLFGAVKLSEWKCNNQWQESGMESKFRFGAGCMIQVNDAWIPAKNYREI